MKSIEVYKGYSIFEAEGDHLSAGFKFQIDVDPGHRLRYLGVKSLEKALETIDWLAWYRDEIGPD
jgi:hypothetical protein